MLNRQNMIDAIIEECYHQDVKKAEAIQYILATVKHETNDTFKPVKEAYWLSEGWRKRNLRYYPYYGRGLVQITWEKNYKKFTKLVNERFGTNQDFVKNPDLVLKEKYAIFILVYGMKYGIFTGKKISDYFNDNGSNFIAARRIINGKDKAKKIAYLAQKIKIG
ncbi:carboxypeptidase [Caminibacter sp.]